MISRIALIAAVAMLGACSAETPDAPEADMADAGAPVTIAATLADVDVVHGSTPNDYVLSWVSEPAGAPVSVRVSTDPLSDDGLLIAEGVTDGSFNWSAEGSLERRYFTIQPAGGAAVTSAVRLLPLEGGRNFRDLGGYPAADGRTVKWGHAFRSGVMAELTDADYDYLSDLGIKTVCDFRDADERRNEPTDWRAGAIDYVTFADPEGSEDPADNPMFASLLDPDSTPEDVANAMAAGYADIAKGEDEGYTAMFDRLAKGEIPLAFNCSAGKDRAGTAAALLLTVLGVPRDIVVHDYSLSDDYVDYMEAFLNDEARAEAEAGDNPYAFLMELPPEKVAPLMASHPMYIEASFASMEEEHGSVLDFIKVELDVTDEEVDAIRSALLH